MKRALWLAAIVFLLAAGLLWAAPSNPQDEKDVRLTTADGVGLAAIYHDAAPGSKGLILLHMLNHNRQDWQGFAAQAATAGFASVAIDLRGHGHSTQGPGGVKLNWKDFKDADFRGMVKDVQAAFDFLVKEKNVNPNKIGIVGASIGANLAVNFAANNPGKVKAVVLLSPGKTYRGVGTEEAVKAYPGKMLFCAAPGDAYSFESVNALVKLAPGRGALKQLGGGAHGTDMFPEHPKLMSEIITWLNQAM